MEFLQAILPGLIQMFLLIATALICNLIFIQLHKRKLTRMYIEEGMTPPEWDWLYREKNKKPKKKQKVGNHNDQNMGRLQSSSRQTTTRRDHTI